MKTADEIVSEVAQFVQSRATIDEVLKDTVRLLNEERQHYDWVGIYLLEGDTLVLHNYVGKPTEHMRIPVGVGVCGVAVAEGSNQIVGDVSKLENYLACSIGTRSEIVVLIRRGAQIFGQIDIDSDLENAFTDQDERLLSRVAERLSAIF
jgi:GAF domain-containing protein